MNCVLATRRAIDLTNLRSACAQALRNRPSPLVSGCEKSPIRIFQNRSRITVESQPHHTRITPESQLNHLPNHSHITGSQPSHGHRQPNHSHKTAELQPNLSLWDIADQLVSRSEKSPIYLLQALSFAEPCVSSSGKLPTPCARTGFCLCQLSLLVLSMFYDRILHSLPKKQFVFGVHFRKTE